MDDLVAHIAGRVVAVAPVVGGVDEVDRFRLRQLFDQRLDPGVGFLFAVVGDVPRDQHRVAVTQRDGVERRFRQRAAFGKAFLVGRASALVGFAAHAQGRGVVVHIRDHGELQLVHGKTLLFLL